MSVVASVAACLTVAASAFLLAPSYAQAADDVLAYSLDDGGAKTEYTSVAAARTAGYTGKTIYMTRDWTSSDFGETFEIADSKTLKIDMQGHIIKGDGEHSVIRLYEHSTLELTSSKKNEITYKGYTSSDGATADVTSEDKVGGLVTGGYCSGSGSAVAMDADSKLDLDSIIVGGNYSKNGVFNYDGIIKASKKCVITMSDGSSLEYNRSTHGAIYVAGDDVSINLDNSSIDHNYGHVTAGISSRSSKTKIDLAANSKISDNVGRLTGGVSFYDSFYTLYSSDGTGVFSNNESLGLNDSVYPSETTYDQNGGGAVHIEQAAYIENEGTIKGLTFTGNKAAFRGGAIEASQEWLTIDNCTFTNNQAGSDGGAICVRNDDVTIKDSTFTGNVCDTRQQRYEGGAIYQSISNDLTLMGKMIIKDNIRKGGTKDDLFLGDDAAFQSYLKGELTSGSTVGIRTGKTDDRRIAKNFTCETKDALFIDMQGYYVSYGSDEGGDAWQRHASPKFTLSTNGTSTGQYAYEAWVTANGASPDATKVFKCWDTDKTTGLYPISDYINDSNKYNQYITFQMPQNDANLVATYLERSKNVEVVLKAPEVGKELSTEGTLKWDAPESEGIIPVMDITVAWYEKKDGALIPATGVAKEATVYVARFSANQNLKQNRAFALDLAASDVSVKLTGAKQENLGASSVNIDDGGNLSVTTNEYTTEGAAVTSIQPFTMSVPEGTSYDDFIKLLPTKAVATTNLGSTINLDFKDGQDWTVLFDEKNKLVKPSTNPMDLSVEVKAPDGITLPDDLKFATITLTVTDAPEETVATPEFKLKEGTYSTVKDKDKFDNDGKLALLADCMTSDAEIKYSLSLLVGNDWEEVVTEGTYEDSINLDSPEASEQYTYKLETWAEKDSSRSASRSLYYVISNDESVETHTLTVSYTDTAAQPAQKDNDSYTVDEGSSFVLDAPNRNGYVFEKWVIGDKEVSTEQYKLENITEDTQVTAVYNPVVTELDFGINLPQADSELATAANYVKAKIGESSDFEEVSSYFVGDSGAAITWSPAVEDGIADHATSYVASLEFKADGQDGVKYVLSKENLKILINGESSDTGSYVAQEDDGTFLHVVCPTTENYKTPVLDSLEDMTIAFADAWKAQTKQDYGKSADWGLPQQVTVGYACGETGKLDINWGSVSGFDKTKLEAQTIEVKGTVEYPANVDSEGAQTEVSIKLNVAAPEVVAAPTASLQPGSYLGTQGIELSCETEGAEIRYTTDGSEPTAESPAYRGIIEVAHNATIKAKAFHDAMTASNTLELAYVIKHTVSFDSAGGSSVDAQEVEDGATAVEPGTPSFEGYEFKGWCLEDGTTYDFAQPVVEDLTLYAKWEKSSKGDDGDDSGDDAADDDSVVDDDSDSAAGSDSEDSDDEATADESSDSTPSTGDASGLALSLAALGVLVCAGVLLRRGFARRL